MRGAAVLGCIVSAPFEKSGDVGGRGERERGDYRAKVRRSKRRRKRF